MKGYRQIVLLMVVLALLLGACAPATSEEVAVEKIEVQTVIVEKEVAVEKKVVETVVVEKEVVVEKKVVETVVVEKEVEKVVTAAPEVAPGVPSEPVDGGTLTYWAYDPPIFSFAATVFKDWQNQYVLAMIYNNLFTVYDDATVKPELAESWEVSDDGLIWTIHLRDDVKWHDGEPFTAEDVEWTMQAIYSPNLQPINNYPTLLATLKGLGDYTEDKAEQLEGVKVVDAHTIQFILDEPDPGFLYSFWERFLVSPKHVFEGVPFEELNQSEIWYTNPVGTGPFKFVEYVPDQYVELVRNEDYFEGKPHIEKVVYTFGSRESALTLLKKGELDLLPHAPYDQIESLMDQGFQMRPSGQPGFWHYIHNNYARDGFWKNPKARQAVQYGVNIDAFVEKFLPGAGRRATSWFSDSAFESPTRNRYPYDPDKAKELFTEAGWDFDNWTLTMAYWPSVKERNDFFIVAQSDLQKIGVKTRVVSVETGGVWDFQQKDPGPEGWDIFQFGTGLSPNPSTYLRTWWYGDAEASAFACGWPFDASERPIEWCWNGDTIGLGINDLIERGETASNLDEQVAIYGELDTILNEQLPFGNIVKVAGVYTFSPRVQGLRPDTPRPFNVFPTTGAHNWWLWPQ